MSASFAKKAGIVIGHGEIVPSRDGFMAMVHFTVPMTGRVITAAPDTITVGLFWAGGGDAIF